MNYQEALALAATQPDAQYAIASAQEALAALRFHEGLRKRWENARAEAAIREASALSYLEGAPVSVDDLRLASLSEEDTQDPAVLLAIGIWRAQWNCASRMTPLNVRGARPTRTSTPTASLVSGIHRDICSGLLRAGHIEANQVSIPRNPRQLQGILRLVELPRQALPVAADVWARMRADEVFTPASAAVGATIARWILVEKGVDPSGVAVLSAWHALHPAKSAEGLNAWKQAQRMDLKNEDERVAYLGKWVATFAEGLAYGASVGRDIALHIQAGRLS